MQNSHLNHEEPKTERERRERSTKENNSLNVVNHSLISPLIKSLASIMILLMMLSSCIQHVLATPIKTIAPTISVTEPISNVQTDPDNESHFYQELTKIYPS